MLHRRGECHSLALQCMLLLLMASETCGKNLDMLQRFDGWYNSLTNPCWGSAGETLRNDIPTAYDDNTYRPSGMRRPSARLLSNVVFRQNSSRPTVSNLNKTALFAFFGQYVTYEIVDSDASTCPVETLTIPIPKCDVPFDMHCEGDKNMPYSRVRYEKITGQSPNSPRQQINAATSYIDGSFIYGTNLVRASFLRQQGTAKFAADSFGLVPEVNNVSLPFENFPSASTHHLMARDKLWKFGDTHVYENPALLSMSLLFFRWHNVVVDEIEKQPELKDWSSEHVFYAARRWVIATQQLCPDENGIHPIPKNLFGNLVIAIPPKQNVILTCRLLNPYDLLKTTKLNPYCYSSETIKKNKIQCIIKDNVKNIIMYEWLPQLLNTSIPEYEGYKSFIHPGVTAVFDAAAIRYLMTLFPSVIHKSGPNMCQSTENNMAYRLCNTYWRSQELLSIDGRTLEEILQGLASQSAEAEDTFVVEDLQSKFYGPLHFSRHDFVALTIMKGRDYGLPDYNTVRSCVRLIKRQKWEDINPDLFKKYPWIFDKLSAMYESIDDLDVFVGGMLETTPYGPGELFTKIILEQFIRIRDGDRFWFENEHSGIFSKDDIEKIRGISLYDIIIKSTAMKNTEIQQDVFTLSDENPCPMTTLEANDVENCTEHQGYDYFHGSEVAYIIIWVCFGLLPFLCVLAAYACAKYKQWQHKRLTVKFEKQNNVQHLEAAENIFKASEWLGLDEKSRVVMLQFNNKFHMDVLSTKRKLLRTIRLEALNPLEVWLSCNKGRTSLLIKIPKEFDLVLIFLNELERTRFERALDVELNKNNCERNTLSVHMQHIYKRAVTKKKRNAMLEKFFKTVFSEAFQMDYDPILDDEIDVTAASEIMEINLTKEEFAEALSMKSSSDFVETIFCKIDEDKDGYITFREFLQAVLLFSKGSGINKLEKLFEIFDIEGKGCLQREKLTRLFRSLLEKADSTVDEGTVTMLVDSMCNQAGMEENPELDFQDFCQIMSPMLNNNNICLNFDGCKKVSTKKRSTNEMAKKKSQLLTVDGQHHQRNSSSASDCIAQHSVNVTKYETKMTDRRERVEAEREKYTPLKAKWKSFKHSIENNRQHIFFLVIFSGIAIALFAERFYYYTVEREHSGLRAMMSYGISVTRGAAAVMSFTFSLLLLTMCRNLITWLRETSINLYIPFDSHVAFHKIVAWTAVLFTVFHVFGYAFNFYHVATQPTNMLCVLDSVILRSDFMPTFDFWLFGNMTGFTGVLLVIVLCIIVVFATQTARRYIFSMFWLTHKLIIPLYIMTILHGASLIVQKPMFYLYFTVPAILFTIDKMVSLRRKKTQITIVKAENLQSAVTYLEFKRPARFEYRSGQWVRIACLAQGKNEYHPFTLTSAPHEDTLKLHIRSLGPWTWTLRHIFEPENLRNQPYPKLYLDGPYGAGQQDWYQYDVSVLVGAGIGVTPYASILKDFVHMSTINCQYKVRCQKLYFIWITGSHRHFEWLLDILREVEEVDKNRVVSIDIFITQFSQNFDLRTAMLYICEEHFQKMSEGRSVFTGLKAATHFGRPQLNKMLQAVQRAHYSVRKIGVFSCGPPGVTKTVQQACVEVSKTTKTLFDHHFENF